MTREGLPGSRLGEGMVSPGGDARQIDSRFPVFPQDVGSKVVSSFPEVPHDGMIVARRVAEGVVWLFCYNASSSSANKWEFIGGPPFGLRDVVNSNVGFAWTAPNSPGDSILTVPLAGLYDVRVGASLSRSTNATMGGHVAALHNGVTYYYRSLFPARDFTFKHMLSFEFQHQLAVSDTYQFRFYAEYAAVSFLDTWLLITPRRVS